MRHSFDFKLEPFEAGLESSGERETYELNLEPDLDQESGRFGRSGSITRGFRGSGNRGFQSRGQTKRQYPLQSGSSDLPGSMKSSRKSGPAFGSAGVNQFGGARQQSIYQPPSDAVARRRYIPFGGYTRYSGDPFPVADRPIGDDVPWAGTSAVAIPTRGAPPREGSEHTRWAQDSLNRILHLELPTDGFMTVATRSAIRSFQKQAGLPVTGVVGPDTERALIDAVSKSVQGDSD
jgi:peptidoglycan hydrolase-like protein with peptidoglycan-binding domain